MAAAGSRSGAVTAADPTGPVGRLLRNPDIRRTFEVTYYDVTGTSWAELEESMDREGPPTPESETGEVWAWESTDSTYSYWYTARGGRCVITDLTVTQDVTIRMPRWKGAVAADASLRARWNRFISDTYQHEQEHAWIGTFEVAAMARLIDLASSAATCSALHKQVDAIADGRWKAGDDRNEEYNDWSDHGNEPLSWIS